MNKIQKQITELIETGQYEEMKRVLSTSDVDLNFKDHTRCSPLFNAVDKLDEELVTTLLTAGADPNYLNYDNISVLYHYTFNLSERDSKNDPSVKIANKLIEAGANVNYKRTKTDLSLLHDAVRKKNNLLVRTLISSGATIDEHENKLGATPLCFPSNPVIVKLLLDANADVYHLQKNNIGILNEYIEPIYSNRNFEMAKMILSRMKVIEEPIIPVLSDMIKNSMYNELTEFILHKDLVVEKNSIVELLNKCAMYDNLTIAKLLLSKFNLNLSATSDNGENPLLISITYRKFRIVELLVESGAQVSSLPTKMQDQLTKLKLTKKMKKLIGLE